MKCAVVTPRSSNAGTLTIIFTPLDQPAICRYTLRAFAMDVSMGDRQSRWFHLRNYEGEGLTRDGFVTV